jgi:uncharacterized membrane protein YhaH (DUF805 family)
MENKEQKPSKVAKWSLIIAIFILLNVFFNVSVGLFLDEPKYENFCKNSYPDKTINNVETCSQFNGEWQNYAVPFVNPDGTTVSGYCDVYTKCQNEMNQATESYELKVFVILIVLGIITFLVSLFLKTNALVGTALSLAAVLNFIIASIRYWSSANEWLRFLILLIALVILIYIAIKKFSDNKNE